MSRPKQPVPIPPHIKMGDLERRHSSISERDQRAAGVEPVKPKTNGNGAHPEPKPDDDNPNIGG